MLKNKNNFEIIHSWFFFFFPIVRPKTFQTTLVPSDQVAQKHFLFVFLDKEGKLCQLMCVVGQIP